MDVVLIGLPGSGKSAIARRLATRHGAELVDIDAEVERRAGRTIEEIFATQGEAGFRALERAEIEALGDASAEAAIRRVLAPGSGAIVDPRNRWSLFRGRRVVWLDARPEAVAQRLRRSPFVRPLVHGHDPLGTIRELAAARTRFFAAAPRVNAMMELGAVVEATERAVAAGDDAAGTVLLRAETPIGEIVMGDGVAGVEVAAALRRLGARRAIVVTEPVAWAAVGGAVAQAIEAAGLPVERIELPSGEAAKRLSTIEAAAGALAGLGADRGEPLVAVGGGALTDAAGFLAATWLRGVPVVHVPTTLAGQVDAAIGGKTAVDLAAGKNLVGAFHQPAAVVIDVGLLAGLPERERRAALAEAVKMAALGEPHLFERLEADGPAIAAGDPDAMGGGGLAEVVERSAWAKVEVVLADEREAAGRIALNLGHTIGHAIEAADGYATLRHGEAVAYGLRVACRLGVERGVTPVELASRVERLLDALELGGTALPLPIDAVVAAIETDKKRAGGRVRWVLPTGHGYELDADIPIDLVRAVTGSVLARRPAASRSSGVAAEVAG